nr:putative protein TIFY 6B-like isoform X4 [Pinus koraiensis]
MNILSQNHQGKPPSEESSENFTASPEQNNITEPNEINVQSPSSLLTVFYAGKVNVYHVSAEKAKTMMAMASGINAPPSSSPSTPSTPINPSSSVAASGGRTQITQTIKSVTLPTTPKFSIQRFLEKRKERLHGGMAPYSPRYKTD